MPRRLGLTVAAILADQSSRNRKRKLVDMQCRRHSSGSCGRRNLERQLLDKRVRAAEYRLEPGTRSSAPQGTCELVDHIIVKVEVQRVDGCLEQIGRASGRERVCPDVVISVVAVSLKKKRTNRTMTTRKLIK